MDNESLKNSAPAEKINLKPDAFASEIRAAFRSLNGKDTAKLINELVVGKETTNG